MRWVNTKEMADGVVYVLFLDWRSRRQGESLVDWKRHGARLRQDVYGYGGGLGYAAYRVRRMVTAYLGLPDEGEEETLTELKLVGLSAAASAVCPENANGASLTPFNSTWIALGTITSHADAGGFWRFAVHRNV